jgi:hypothetical protein
VRFHVGAPPPRLDFHPTETGWTALRKPRPPLFNLIAIPFSLLGVALASVSWGRVFRGRIAAAPAVFGCSAAWLGPLAVLLCAIPLLIVAHELIHALGYPRLGFSDRTILGIWSSRFLFFAAYRGGMGRNRWLLVYLLPFLVLSIVPAVISRGTGLYSAVLQQFRC